MENRAAALNEALKPLAEVLGLYDFGGNNFVVPSPTLVDLNGNRHEMYILTFEK